MNGSVIDDLIKLRFMHNRESAVFLGIHDVGGTHLSLALGMRKLKSDVFAHYTSEVKLVESLRKEFTRDRFSILISSYSEYKIMIVDEIGYLSLNREKSNHLF